MRAANKRNRPRWDQARRIIGLFGGVANVALLLGVDRGTVYRWGWAAPHGCDGIIPAKRQAELKLAARAEGVLIRASDWEPREIDWRTARI